ncbi:AfsR/SARP family transcriptional regulator [Actinophytocola oryzae]|uniref:DNA-binding SARP family transcriptional activator n=1 Tax=Actinophytocola oryzae TaxID=502181 RepID=A0A4R7W3E4_9PSEU|nr:BTAD domain-containing putative transcriptional regulator [Actinophytocola oryzae]TDV56137.1 DNA-binding SARP family transcriptional activator [Actinophytocola oryzae]
MELRLFGELEVWSAGRSLEAGTPRQQAVLAALVVDARRPVAIDTLVNRVWDDRLPANPRAVLYSHLSRIRRLLGPSVCLERRPAGYVLDIDPDLVDLHRFRRLVDQGHDDRRDDGVRLAALTEALGLWRGEPLCGLSGAWVTQVRDSWHQRRLDAVMLWAQTELRLGHPAAVTAFLPDLAAEYPLVEPIEALLILALHATGRGAEALDRYTAVRQRLADELGTDPGPELRAAHQAVLATTSTSVTGDRAAGAPIPRQLPAAPRAFTGREAELSFLTTVADAADRQGGTMVVSAIGGTGGIGKTWLAVRWAHDNVDRFADGQLFTDLRGFSPAEQPAPPADVLGGFLHALGVDRDRQPAGLDARAELYRSLMAGRRMLVVLDNAVSTEQVIPLLPGGAHCMVVVTSRNQLGGLAARHGAFPVHLDALSNPEARTLLATALGADRVDADPSAIAELVELCGGFPLALGVITARAATNPHLPLRDVVADLRALGLDALDSDDHTASLPAVLSWSLHHLTDRHREVFALLGIAPGPDTGLPAAAALTGLPERETHAVLRVLVEASLVDRGSGGRYGMHALVRDYATSTAATLLPHARETALRRVLDFYADTANAADRLLNPHRDPTPFEPPTSGARPHFLPDPPAAWAWFDTEHACLLAAQQTAAAHLWHLTVCSLAASLYTFHYRRGHRHDHVTVCRAAADAAAHLPDPTAFTYTHRHLGRAYANLGDHDNAFDHLHKAVALAEHHQDLLEQAHTHDALAWAWELRGDERRALDHARHALDRYRTSDVPKWTARALNNVGWSAARVGDYDTARDHCQAALALHRRHRNTMGEATTLDSLGYIEHHSGHHHQAIDHYQHALILYRDFGHAYEIANTLADLGHPRAALGQTEQACAAWREALRLYREQHRDDDATWIQHELDKLDPRPTR